MNLPERIPVVVSVDDEHLSKVDEVVARLRAAGMEVAQTLAHAGAVTGHVDSGRYDALKQLQGVSGVWRERTFQLPPPDAKIQ